MAKQRYFAPIYSKLEAIMKLDVDDIALRISNTIAFKTYVIKLNTEGLPSSQLYELGEDSTGRKLEDIGGSYSPYTVKEKLRKGQPIDRVTLKDTGDFYATFKVIPFKGGFTIEANTIKDRQNLENDWGTEIIGLNQENLQRVIDYYKEIIADYVREQINAA